MCDTLTFCICHCYCPSQLLIVLRDWFLSLIVYRQDEDNIRKKIRDKERQIQQVKYRANDRLLKFGAWMPKLVNTIKTAVRDGRFTKPPRGPIGDIYLYTVNKIQISCCITGVTIVKTFVNSMLSLSFLNETHLHRYHIWGTVKRAKNCNLFCNIDTKRVE